VVLKIHSLSRPFKLGGNHLLFSALVLGCVILCGCSKGSRDVGLNSKADVLYPHGSKIIIQHLKDKGEIHFYQSDIKIKPSLIINAKALNEKHSFELDSMAFYKDEQPPPTVVTFTLTHDTPKKIGWRFPPNPKLIIIADDKRYESPLCQVELPTTTTKESKPKCYEIELKKDDPSDAEYYEMLIMEIPFEMFSFVGNAHMVRMQIGSATFEVPSETIAALKSFADIASGKDAK
jgi:hypothetical protein